jgi:hypothetical protein
VRQQVFEFAQETLEAPPIPLDPRVVDEVVRLMAMAIVAVTEEGAGNDGSTNPSAEQDHG